jgi:hypothetical protein
VSGGQILANFRLMAIVWANKPEDRLDGT